MQKRLSLLIMFTVLTTYLTTGCYDVTEIDDSIYAIVIGIDRGATNKVRITIQYPTYTEGGGGGGSMGGGSGGKSSSGGDKSQENKLEGSNVHTMEASSMLEAVNFFNTAITRSTSLTHTKLLVISEDFAREGLKEYIAPIARFREVRRTMQVVVVKGNADEFIRQNKTNIGPSVSKASELMLQQSDTTGFFPKVSFTTLYDSMLSPYTNGVTSYAAINNFTNLPEAKPGVKPPVNADTGIMPGQAPRVGVTKREFIGTAVFQGDKMVGALNSNETRYMLMLQNKYKYGIMTFQDKHDPNSVIPCDIRLGRNTAAKAHFEDGKPVIDVKVNIEADVGAVQSRYPYEKLDNLMELNDEIKDNIKKGIIGLIEKTQKEYKTDIFGFGYKVARNFNTIPEFIEYNWLQHYPETKVNVTVNVGIRRTGLMIKSAQIISNQGPK